MNAYLPLIIGLLSAVALLISYVCWSRAHARKARQLEDEMKKARLVERDRLVEQALQARHFERTQRAVSVSRQRPSAPIPDDAGQRRRDEEARRRRSSDDDYAHQQAQHQTMLMQQQSYSAPQPSCSRSYDSSPSYSSSCSSDSGSSSSSDSGS